MKPEKGLKDQGETTENMRRFIAYDYHKKPGVGLKDPGGATDIKTSELMKPEWGGGKAKA